MVPKATNSKAGSDSRSNYFPSCYSENVTSMKTFHFYVNHCFPGLLAASEPLRSVLFKFLIRSKHQNRDNTRQQELPARLLHWPQAKKIVGTMCCLLMLWCFLHHQILLQKFPFKLGWTTASLSAHMPCCTSSHLWLWKQLFSISYMSDMWNTGEYVHLWKWSATNRIILELLGKTLACIYPHSSIPLTNKHLQCDTHNCISLLEIHTIHKSAQNTPSVFRVLQLLKTHISFQKMFKYENI